MTLATASARRFAASAAALVLMTGAGVGLAGAAHADPDNANGQGAGQSQADHPGKPKGKDKNRGDGRGNGQGHGPRGNGNGNGHANGHGNNGNHGNGNNGNHGNGNNGNGGGSGGGSGSTGGGQDGGNGGRGGSQDPAGNNGTVKIAPLGEFDGIPNNTPHPGCTFLVEWYGFDEGADVVSTVTFAMHAPTSDVGLTVDGPSEVFVGEDPASGAGTDSGLDARQAYTLAFDGEPHPKQGYHVKLTINTPRSQGSDKKSKVFWVEPCESAPSGTEDDSTEGGTEGSTGGSGTEADQSGVEGSVAAPQGGDTDQGVMGEVEAPAGAGAADDAGVDDDAAVPTSVDAGDGRNPVMDAFTSPWGLAAILLGLLTAVGAFALRRRATE